MMEKALIIGETGFIGSALCEILLEEGIETTVAGKDRSETNEFFVRNALFHTLSDCQKTEGKFDAVFYIPSVWKLSPVWEDVPKAAEQLLRQTKSAVQTAKRTGGKLIVLTGFCREKEDNPIPPKEVLFLICESYLRHLHIPCQFVQAAATEQAVEQIDKRRVPKQKEDQETDAEKRTENVSAKRISHALLKAAKKSPDCSKAIKVEKENVPNADEDKSNDAKNERSSDCF